MARVSIRYKNGTTVEANNLGDALVHLAHTGIDYVTDVIEQQETQMCEHCGGTGVATKQPDPVVVLTGEQVQEKVSAINDEAPHPDSTFDDRVKAARRIAKG